MAEITVRKNGGQAAAALAPIAEPRWEPFRLRRDLMGWDPFREMTPYLAMHPSGFVPSFEVKETKDSYIFKADVPGVKEGDISVTVTGNRLTISGKREEEHREHTDAFYTYERSYGDFTRSFTLPDRADASSAHADLKEGVLTVTVKKTAEMCHPSKVSPEFLGGRH